MLTVISPAKTLDYTSELATERYSQPQLLQDSSALISLCRDLTPAQIGSLMKISDALAGL
ncbi:MAG: peroxide stress protein YaaA, partial [Plesiomonas sp.]